VAAARPVLPGAHRRAALTTPPAHRALTDAAALAGVTLGDGSGPGWVPYPDLLRPGPLAALVERTADLFGGSPTRAARAAAATLALGDVAASVAGPVAAALVVRRRALTIRPGGLALRFGVGGVTAIAVADARVETGADVGRLRRTVAEGHAALLAPLVDALAPVAGRGRRGLRAEALERLAAALFLAARTAGRPHDAPAEVEGVVGPVPWVGVGGVPWKRRIVCCLAYQTPGLAGAYCATCPLVTPAETARRTGAWLADR
jgi:hypothetical protein